MTGEIKSKVVTYLQDSYIILLRFPIISCTMVGEGKLYTSELFTKSLSCEIPNWKF